MYGRLLRAQRLLDGGIKCGERQRAIEPHAFQHARLEQPSDNGVMDWLWIAAIHTRLGAKDLAFQWPDKDCQKRDFFLTFAKVHPYMDPLRADPRFDAFLKRLNFPQ